MSNYNKIGRLFIKLEAIRDDLESLKAIRDNMAEDSLKATITVEFKDQENKPVSLSTFSTLNYFIHELERRERAVRGQIDRKINRKWYEFWKLW